MSPLTDEQLGMVEATVQAAACDEAGLSDFGDADYLMGLRVLAASLREDLGLTDERLVTAATLSTKAALVSRLYSEAGWKSMTSSAVVGGPLFIVGMPRSGTTALHHLLASDGRFQGLESWIVRNPMVRPDRRSWAEMPLYRRRVLEAEQSRHLLGDLHWVAADEYDECQMLMAQTMVSNTFGSQRSIPTYDEWYLNQDHRPAFERLERNLRLIGSGQPPGTRWLLKNPSHLLSLDSLLDVFPDATIVVTHRDPVSTLPSLCHLLMTIRSYRWADAPDLDGRLIATRELRMWTKAVERLMALDERLPGRLYHVKHEQLLRDPLGVARGVFSEAGIAFTDSGARGMSEWADSHRPPASGSPRRPGDFDLSPQRIKSTFSDYRRRYLLDSAD